MEEISVKGWRNGLLLVVPPEGDWAEILTRLDDKLNEAKVRSFWRGAETTLDLGARPVAAGQIETLITRLKNAFGLVPVAVVSVDEDTRTAAGDLGLSAHEEMPVVKKPPRRSPTGAPPSNALYVAQTVRSGQRITHDGHLVIRGDVNAGAEVVAEGDILVFGTLRGVAHAGCFGDQGARIVALDLRPTQIRIAGLIARSPDAGAPPPQGKHPEVASIQDGDIQIHPL